MRTSRTSRRAATLIAAVVLQATAPASSPSQTLDSLVRLAEATHPSVDAARAAIARADARARAAEAWQPPSVGLELGGLPLAEPIPFARGETMIMAEQMIPLFGQNRAMARAERLGAAVADNALEAARRELRARVEREYLALWLLDRRRALNAESRAIAAALFAAVEGQYAVGRAPQSELFRITLEIERLGAELRDIDEERLEARARLNAIVGRDRDVAIDVVDSLPGASPAPIDSLAARIGAHPSLRRMEAMAAMARAEAEAQLAMLDPMLMVRGGVMYAPEGHPIREGSEMVTMLTGGEHGATGPDPDPMRWGLTVGAMISIPIAPWSRSGPEARAEEHRLIAEEQLIERRTMELEMEGMLESAWGQARRAQSRLEYHRRTQIPLLERSLVALRGDYTAGRATFASLLDGYSMLVMARTDAFMQEMERAMALSMITELTGMTR